ncbi:Mur ligase family protein, partial [Jatrophihabitans endophyticus]|uniref:Mur ligase family protein n=1 Tax=Jatrophihabitans endophyticus TaxID=1206085 RepID=UPI001A09E3B8
MATTAEAGVPRPSSVAPSALSALSAGRGTVRGADVGVTGITASSDRVQPGDLFVALPGRTTHGATFAGQACASGAVAVLTDGTGISLLDPAVPAIEVPDVRGVLGDVSADVYGRPSRRLRMLGVTGTSGKTTTTFLMRAGLVAAGRSPGLIGTVATMIGADEVTTGFTTPEAPDLQALLAVMVERGVTDLAMEVSSHALAMGRVGGIGFDVAGFLNLSEDHLDFHRDMEDYFAAKARLFDARSRRAVVVVDDDWGRRLAGSRRDAVTVCTTGAAADWSAGEVVERADGSTTFTVTGPAGVLRTGCAIPGRYNVANAVTAVAMLYEAGVDPEVAATAIATASVP